MNRVRVVLFLKVTFCTLLVLVVSILLTKLVGYFGQPSAQVRNVRDPEGERILDISRLPTKGNINAKVILAEFSDYECPYCSRHAQGTAIELEEKYVRSGKVRLAFVNNPLAMHHNARMLAKVAICAGRQNRYWEMHDILFREKPKTAAEAIAIAEKLEINRPHFRACFEANGDVEKDIDNDLAKAREFQLNGTPSFAIGTLNNQGKVRIHKFILGAVSVEIFEKYINETLAKPLS